MPKMNKKVDAFFDPPTHVDPTVQKIQNKTSVTPSPEPSCALSPEVIRGANFSPENGGKICFQDFGAIFMRHA